MNIADSVILSSPVFLILVIIAIVLLVMERFFDLHNIARISSILLTLIMIPFLFLRGCSLTEMVVFLCVILLVHVIDVSISVRKEDSNAEGGEQK